MIFHDGQDWWSRWSSADPSKAWNILKDKGSVAAESLLNGMLAQERLLDIVENFVLYDESKPGETRKVVAR
jgi:type I site-specific restriction-modification system R (restriction) subunit